MERSRARLRSAAAAVVLATLSSCSSGGSQPAPTRSTSTSPTPSPSAATPVAARLQQLAAKGKDGVFHATYVVRQHHPSSHAVWQVWHTPRSLRVDVVTKHVTATLIRTPRATYSCRRARHHSTCFRVARSGKPVPAPFRLLAEQLFANDLSQVARQPDLYKVSVPAPGTVHVKTGGGTCFQVTARKAAPRSHAATAVYCFNGDGVLTAVAYPSGNVVRVTRVSLSPPRRDAFVPYSTPTPLPS